MPLRMRALPSAAVLVLALTPLLTAQVTERFLVAVVRDDGLIRPMAAVDRGRWRESWPKAAKQVEVPIRLRDVPRRWWGGVPFTDRWRLVSDQDGAERAITIDGITWVPSYCQQQLMLTSADAVRDMLRPADGIRAANVGLALMGGGEVVLVTRHDEQSALARQIGVLLLDAFDAAEQRVLLAYAAPYVHPLYVHPLSRTERAAYPLRVITAVRGPGLRGDVTYFEAIRHYPRGETQQGDADLAWCDTVTFASGWLFPGREDEFEVRIVRTAITSCLLDSVRRRSPLGVVRTERGPVWVFEEWLPHGEWYSAYEPPTRRDEYLLLRVGGGWCAR
jgi:hypothetical protein